MTSNRSRLAGMTPRQIGVTIAFIIVLIIIIWQVKGLFSNGTPAPTTSTTTVTTTATPAMTQGMANRIAAQQPVQASLVKKTTLSQQELEMLKLQQQTQARYLAALNELQMLRIQREMAEATQAIAVAKLATVTAQKNTINLLSPPAPPPAPPESYAPSLISPEGGARLTTTKPPAPITPPQEVGPTTNYTVISIAQVRYKWSAVLGYGGNLYSVTIGDTLPVDGSRVMSIDRAGVTLSKDGIRKRISLVPII